MRSIPIYFRIDSSSNQTWLQKLNSTTRRDSSRRRTLHLPDRSRASDSRGPRREKMWLSTVSATPGCYSICMDPGKCNGDWEKVCQLAQRWFCLVYLAVNHGLDASDADKSIPTIGQLMCGGDKGDRWGSAQKIFSRPQSPRQAPPNTDHPAASSSTAGASGGGGAHLVEW
jgi:hypothetical protein